jgi:addiction module HigA family antidote
MKARTAGNRIKTHPGVILKAELAARGLSANRFALSLGVPAGRILDILHQRRGISPDTAIRIGTYLGTSAEFWLNMQLKHDLSKVEQEKGKAIRSQVRSA